MGRHVKKEKVDDDPEKRDLDHIHNVNRVEATRLEIRFEKKGQAGGAEPEHGNDVSEIGDVVGWRDELNVEIQGLRETKNRKRDCRDVPKIVSEVSRPTRGADGE